MPSFFLFEFKKKKQQKRCIYVVFKISLYPKIYKKQRNKTYPAQEILVENKVSSVIRRSENVFFFFLNIGLHSFKERSIIEKDSNIKNSGMFTGIHNTTLYTS